MLQVSQSGHLHRWKTKKPNVKILIIGVNYFLALKIRHKVKCRKLKVYIKYCRKIARMLEKIERSQSKSRMKRRMKKDIKK